MGEEVGWGDAWIYMRYSNLMRRDLRLGRLEQMEATVLREERRLRERSSSSMADARPTR